MGRTKGSKNKINYKAPDESAYDAPPLSNLTLDEIGQRNVFEGAINCYQDKPLPEASLSKLDKLKFFTAQKKK